MKRLSPFIPIILILLFSGCAGKPPTLKEMYYAGTELNMAAVKGDVDTLKDQGLLGTRRGKKD